MKAYIAIDLKSFYASVECVERGLDPLNTNLVVADPSRTDKTICLAVSPSLKAHGVGGRPRLFEVVRRVREVNRDRSRAIGWRPMKSKSVFASVIASHPDCELDYIVAPPRMALYVDYSTRIFKTYLKYIAPEDLHVYSIDEIFIDATAYVKTYRMTPHQLAITMIRDVLSTTGITATAGIGTNLYLCKVAMDIVAKKMEPDADGVRIAQLDEPSYRRLLWDHQPLTDFWRVGRGIMNRLQPYGICTMGDIARTSLSNENFLYQLFGVNAELLIDHAWGWEPCTIDKVKAYRPETNSMSSGQVLSAPYTFDKALVVIQEMAETIALDLLDHRLVTDQLVVTVGYDSQSLTDPAIRSRYHGPVSLDHYGRPVPRHSLATSNLKRPTLSSRIIKEAATELFTRITNPDLLIRRLNLTANHLVGESSARCEETLQMDLFTDYDALNRKLQIERQALDKERRLMEATLALKKRFGKNALLKGLDFREGATARERNSQIGGHKA